jgi:hypothetical protein
MTGEGEKNNRSGRSENFKIKYAKKLKCIGSLRLVI